MDVNPIARDEEISKRLRSVLDATGWFTDPRVEVREGVVFLSGRAQTDDLKTWAGDLARNTQDVVAVANRMEVLEPSVWDFSPAWSGLLMLWRDVIRSLPFFLFGILILALSAGAGVLATRGARTLLRSKVRANLLRRVIARGIGVLVFLCGVYIILRVKYLKRVVDRDGVVRIYYARGGKPHIRLDAPEGTPAFIEAYEAAQRAKAIQWRLAQRAYKARRSMRDLVELYQRSESYARLAPPTQRVYDRVLHRLLHVEGLADKSALLLGRKRIQQLVNLHVGTPAAAADLLKKLRILFRCAIDHGWRSEDPTCGVTIGRAGDGAARRPS